MSADTKKAGDAFSKGCGSCFLFFFFFTFILPMITSGDEGSVPVIIIAVIIIASIFGSLFKKQKQSNDSEIIMANSSSMGSIFGKSVDFGNFKKQDSFSEKEAQALSNNPRGSLTVSDKPYAIGTIVAIAVVLIALWIGAAIYFFAESPEQILQYFENL